MRLCRITGGQRESEVRGQEPAATPTTSNESVPGAVATGYRTQYADASDSDLRPIAGSFDRTASASTDFESWWRKWLHDGFIPNTALPTKTVAAKSDWASSLARMQAGRPRSQRNTFELIFRSDPSIYDGRFANNGWLQELPKPLTKITWDNVAYVSPATAQKLGVRRRITKKTRRAARLR